ncbi:hypothetical protein PYCC9005_005468 [Savitreella phatthalungensis]
MLPLTFTLFAIVLARPYPQAPTSTSANETLAITCNGDDVPESVLAPIITLQDPTQGNQPGTVICEPVTDSTEEEDNNNNDDSDDIAVRPTVSYDCFFNSSAVVLGPALEGGVLTPEGQKLQDDLKAAYKESAETHDAGPLCRLETTYIRSVEANFALSSGGGRQHFVVTSARVVDSCNDTPIDNAPECTIDRQWQ